MPFPRKAILCTQRDVTLFPPTEMTNKNDKNLEPNPAASNLKWTVMAVLMLAYFAGNYMQYQLSPISQEIMESYSITSAMFSKVFSAPMIPAVLFSLVSGILTDRIGAKPVIGVSLIITAAGSILRFFSTTYSVLFLSMALIGVSAAVMNANGVKVLSGSVPKEKIGFFTGIVLTSSTIAMTLGTGTTSLFPSLRSVYLIAVVLGIAAAVLWFIFAKNTVPVPKSLSGTSVPASLKEAARHPSVWLAGISLFFVMACLIGISSFMPLALADRGMDTVTAGSYTAVFTAGNLVGSFVSPAIDQIWRHTKAQTLILLLTVGLGTAFAWCIPSGFFLFLVLLLAGIGVGGNMPLLMSMPLRSGEFTPENAGIAGGITSTLQLLGAILLPSYIIAPIAGDDLPLFFIITGSLIAIPFVIDLIAFFRISQAKKQ